MPANEMGGESFPSLPDYPAAHSMDTTWYAVDLVGHVAIFETGENGHAPAQIESVDDAHLESMASEMRGDPRPDGEFAWRPTELLASEAGFFLYDFSESYDPIDPYTRTVVPEKPVHVDQLAPGIRSGCKAIRFPIRFSETTTLQPIEYYQCVFWYEDRVCFVLSDGKTVRPFPGKEAEFAGFVREFRRTSPKEAAGYLFEGLGNGR